MDPLAPTRPGQSAEHAADLIANSEATPSSSQTLSRHGKSPNEHFDNPPAAPLSYAGDGNGSDNLQKTHPPLPRADEWNLDLASVNPVLEAMSALERLAWGIKTFGPKLVMLSSMQRTASVLMHLFFQLKATNDILFVDTGFHFHETLRYRDQMLLDYRLNLRTLYPALTPEAQEQAFGRKLHLFVDGQPECCRLRKEEPFLSYMYEMGKKVTVSGLRTAEGGKRRKVAPLLKDPRFGGYVLHPIYDWSNDELQAYLRDKNIPIHPLHAQDFPSIGCGCCTTAVLPGEDERAGRWRHLRTSENQAPVYCGINFSDGSGI